MVVRSAAKSLYGELEEGEVSTKWAANGAFRLCWFGISYHKGSDPDENSFILTRTAIAGRIAAVFGVKKEIPDLRPRGKCRLRRRTP